MNSTTIDSAVKSITASIADLNEAYAAGQHKAVLEATTEPVNELILMRAWCEYHQKNYDACFAELNRAAETQGTLALQAYLYAYAEGYKSEEKLMQLIPKIDPTNINALNALAITARNPDSKIEYSTIAEKVSPMMALNPLEATVTAAHVLHNMARLSLAREDYPDAEKFIAKAIECYGTDTNMHHRGAAHYWQSVIYEKQGKIDQAWEAAKQSLAVWEEQAAADPSNTGWKDRVEGARKREQAVFSLLGT